MRNMDGIKETITAEQAFALIMKGEQLCNRIITGTLSFEDIEVNMPVVLEDLLTKQKVSFNVGETYSFKGNKDDANRFVIHFGDIPLSVNNTSAIAPIVFANNKLITVKLAEANNAQATIYNVSGQLVQTVNVTNTFTQINSNLPSGVYVVEINNGGTITREKVVIQ